MCVCDKVIRREVRHQFCADKPVMDEISGALSTESFTKSTGKNDAKSIYMHMSKDM